MSRRLAAVEAAHHVLSEAQETDLTNPRRTAALLGRMDATIRALLGVLEEQPRHERLAAQHAEELANLNRAVDMELGALEAALKRLARMELARRSLLAPKEGGR